MVNNVVSDFGGISTNLDKVATNKALKSLGTVSSSDHMKNMFIRYKVGGATTKYFI